MYDWPEIQTYTDQFWVRMHNALANNGVSVPSRLSRRQTKSTEHDQQIVLSQTCAYPLVTQLPPSTQLVGTPVYQVDLFKNGQYASAILVRKNDERRTLAEFENATLAYNSMHSQSGFNALKSLLVSEHLLHANNAPFFSSAVCTLSHRKSIAAVASGDADICAIDPVSWALSKRHDKDTQKLTLLTHSAYSPALPLYSDAKAIPADKTQEQWRALIMSAFKQAIDQQSENHMLLSDITYIDKSTYFKLPISHIKMIADEVWPAD